MSELATCMEKLPQVLINLEVNHKKAIQQMPEVAATIDRVKQELGDDGRVLVRYSGTQSMLRVMIEGKNDVRIKQLAEDIAKKIKEEIGCPSPKTH